MNVPSSGKNLDKQQVQKLLQQRFDVSRETLQRLEIYEALLLKWQRKINLIGPSTVKWIWQRHFLDSVQLLPWAPPGWQSWVDLGSGAGFPGLPVAIISKRPVTLIESDQRKAVFMREVIRQTGAPATVVDQRIEEAPPRHADVISARALAPLDRLLDLASRHAGKNTVYLFLKGRNIDAELTQTTKYRSMKLTQQPSLTARDSVILRLEGEWHDAE